MTYFFFIFSFYIPFCNNLTTWCGIYFPAALFHCFKSDLFCDFLNLASESNSKVTNYTSITYSFQLEDILGFIASDGCWMLMSFILCLDSSFLAVSLKIESSGKNVKFIFSYIDWPKSVFTIFRKLPNVIVVASSIVNTGSTTKPFQMGLWMH